MSAADRLIELVIIRRTIRELGKAGFVPVSVWDSEEYVPATSCRKVIETLQAVDYNCTVHFAPASDVSDWGRMGVMFVLGNGIDVISDYHLPVNKPEFGAAMERIAEYVKRLESA
jgi:hypothetical protein